MQLIKRILSIFKKPKKRILYYHSFHFLYIKDQHNLAAYKAYPGLQATLQEMSFNYKRYSMFQYCLLREDRLESLQNLCDALGIILCCKSEDWYR
jgi:hypothetical protein